MRFVARKENWFERWTLFRGRKVEWKKRERGMDKRRKNKIYGREGKKEKGRERKTGGEWGEECVIETDL